MWPSHLSNPRRAHLLAITDVAAIAAEDMYDLVSRAAVSVRVGQIARKNAAEANSVYPFEKAPLSLPPPKNAGLTNDVSSNAMVMAAEAGAAQVKHKSVVEAPFTFSQAKEASSKESAKAPAGANCYNCGVAGHYMADCPSARRDRGDRPQFQPRRYNDRDRGYNDRGYDRDRGNYGGGRWRDQRESRR